MKHIKKILIPAAIVGGVTIVIAKLSKLCKKESSDHIDLTLNDDDIDDIEKEMEKDIEVMPEISGENEREIWDFGDLI